MQDLEIPRSGRRLETVDLTEKATRGERDALGLGSRPST